MTTYHLDPSHSQAAFTARHMMLTKVRGDLKITQGTLEFDAANPADASVEVHLDAASISTGDGNRDNHLRSPDFLNAAEFPALVFKSTRIETRDGKTAKVHGDLTIRDVTRPVVIEAEYLGAGKDPWGNDVVAFAGSTKINREDWGLTWNVALEAGGWLVSRDIEIALDVQAKPVAETVAAG
jgi:polyisoprenoid-binding protein YceI